MGRDYVPWLNLGFPVAPLGLRECAGRPSLSRRSAACCVGETGKSRGDEVVPTKEELRDTNRQKRAALAIARPEGCNGPRALILRRIATACTEVRVAHLNLSQSATRHNTHADGHENLRGPCDVVRR